MPQARRFDWSNLGLRVASAVVLVPAAIGLTWIDTPRWPFLMLIAVGVALLSIEWGGMSAPKGPMRAAIAVTGAVLLSMFVAHLGHPRWGWALMFAGAGVACLVARKVAARPTDVGYGVLYIAPAAICLIWLRSTHQGVWWTLMLFAVTWSADIGAYAVGNLLKGPKLWPRFSPNKTWSGFIGGLAVATIVGALMSVLSTFELNLWAAAFIGLAVGLATMAGDLWESALKRRFGVKDSGDLIPGHGGLLDRVDGLMFAVVVMALARYANYLGWGH